MRGKALALVAAVAAGSGASAQTALVSAGSLSLAGMQAEGEAFRHSDFRLTPNLWLRIDSIETVHSTRTALIDPYRHGRRTISAFDYYPDAGSGFHLSIGMRSRPKAGRMIGQSVNADLRSRLAAPAVTGTVHGHEDVKRTAPIGLVGWSTMLDAQTGLRLDAGAMAIRAKRNNTALAVADPAAYRMRGTSMGATAQVSFVHRF